jgi:hypothetical protein
MSDVFLSYASEDRARLEPLVQALRTAGLEVFWDQSIRVGEQWRKVLRQEIAQAKCVLAVWSRHSADSRWVELEAGEAQAMKKLISAKIDAVEIPFGFGLDQIADLSRWDGKSHTPSFRALLQTVRDTCGRATPASAETRPSPIEILLDDLLRQGFEQVPGPPGLAFVVCKSRMGGLMPHCAAAVEVRGQAEDIEEARKMRDDFERFANSLIGKNGMASLIFVAPSPSAEFVDRVQDLGPKLFGGGRVGICVYDADSKRCYSYQHGVGKITTESCRLG